MLLIIKWGRQRLPSLDSVAFVGNIGVDHGNGYGHEKGYYQTSGDY
jgi:hypothetical protein